MRPGVAAGLGAVDKVGTDGVVLPAEVVSCSVDVSVLVLFVATMPGLLHDSGLGAGEPVMERVAWLENEHCWLAVEQLTHTG